MINVVSPLPGEQNLFGLFELDATGTVLYSRTEPDEKASAATPADISGHNFFDEVAPFENVDEFRRRIGNFTNSFTHADNFNFILQFGDRSLPVRVLLARIRERSDGDSIKSILVHIRKA